MRFQRIKTTPPKNHEKAGWNMDQFENIFPT